MAKTKNIFGANMADMMSPKNSPSEQEDSFKDDIFKGDIPCAERNKFIPLDELQEAPAEWNEYPPADEETFQKMMDSMLKYGQLKVAMVRKEDNGKYMIIGGHNRYRVLQALHEAYPEKEEFKGMKCNVYTKRYINDEAFRLAIVEDNEAQRAKEDTKLLAIGYNVRKACYENSSVKTYGIGSRQKLREKYNLSNGVASRLEQIGNNLIKPYINLYVIGEISQNDAVAISTLPEALQEHLLAKNVYKINPAQRKAIVTCTEKAQLDKVLNIKPTYNMNGVDMEDAVPKKTKALKLFIPNNKQELVLKALNKAIDGVIKTEELSELEEQALQYNIEMLTKYVEKLNK